MVDHVKAIGRKITFPKLAVFGYTLLFFLYFIPISELQIIRQIPFENLFGASWVFIIGAMFIVEGSISFSDLKKGGARFAGYMVIGIGVIAVILGGFIASEGINVFSGNEMVQWLFAGILGLSTALFFSMVSSELIHRKSFLHVVEKNL